MAQPGDATWHAFTLPSGEPRVRLRYYDVNRKRQAKVMRTRGELERWWFGTATTEGERARILRQAELDRGAGKSPLRDYQRVWVDTTDLSAPSVSNGKSLWRRHIADVFGDAPVDTITRRRVNEWVTAMVQDGVTYETRRYAVIHLRRLLHLARDRGAVAVDATDGVHLGPRDQEGAVDPPSSAHVLAVINEAPPRDRLLIRFLALTGMRQSEAFALTVGDLQLTDGVPVARVAAVVEAVTGAVKARTKTGKSRLVALPAPLAEELREHVRGKGKSDLVFTSPEGKTIRAGNWRRRVWKPALDRARAKDNSIPEFTPHDLRHYYAVASISAGVPDLFVTRQLGHASSSFTKDRYGWWTPEGGAQVADAVAVSLGYTDTTATASTDTDTTDAVSTSTDTTTSTDADTTDTATDTDLARYEAARAARRRRRYETRGVPPLMQRDQ
ncbi:hypothetical protein HMPREF3048_10590 [Corynebacterium sp. HMSC075D04]|uniref:tyrosine-type recombinase/integrase n=1 Tax=Corynebacterium sp. HMSC075D04 TaxID=1739540 RepID=UPI0008A196D7|nr:site-specific integrase [Corynebacterium sp. HMSC075D04]OFO33584.1 hypothetical protein HMPREF3048_10590 [Corynebacterium sp. HMSC075D04]